MMLAQSFLAPGDAIHAYFMAPIVSPHSQDLIVGWQIGPRWSKLSVYAWTPQGLADIAPASLTYSRLEVILPPNYSPNSGQAALALWMHDTEEAYHVEIVRWQGNRFVPALDVYPYYFCKVAEYYAHLLRLQPDSRIYKVHWEGARIKAGLSPEVESEFRFEKVGLPNDTVNLYPASVKEIGGTKWGYIDAAGSWVIKPIYGNAHRFQMNGLAVVELDGHSGLIDRKGNFIVRPIYDWIDDFKEGRAVVIDKQGFAIIDEKGHRLTKQAYTFISGYSDGRAMFSRTQNGSYVYGYLDRKGKEVIPPQFLEANDFIAGKAVVKIRDNEYALIDLNGKHLATYPYAYVGPQGEGLMAFRRTQDGKYGYINMQGQVVIEPQYTVAMPFENNRAIVNLSADENNRYGLINRQGKAIIAAQYNDIRWLGEQRVALGHAIDPKQPFVGSKYAVSDLDGHVFTDYRFYEVDDYHNRLASVTDDQYTYFIDLRGIPAENLPKVAGSGILTLEGPLVRADIDQRLSYYDRFRQLVWAQNTVIPLSPPYEVIEHKYKPNRNYLVYYPQVQGMSDAAAQKNVNLKLRELSQVKDVPSGQLDYSYTGDFDVSFYHKQLLQLELTGYNFPFGAAHGMPTQVYVHMNLANGRLYQLKDLFKPGSDYVKVLSDMVGEQIKNDPQYDYVFPDTYKGIVPDQPFFVSKDALHLYFQPYEIAPYAAGFPTFTIPFAEIMNIIDTNGEFWQAFH